MQTFVDVGNALMAIRDGRLYRQSHATFEDYCQSRWSMTRGYANEIIRAANVVQNLDGIPSNLLPQSVHQVRPMTTLTPDQQREAWREVVETAPDSGITGKHVASIVERYKAPEPDDRQIDPDTGEILNADMPEYADTQTPGSTITGRCSTEGVGQ